MNKNLKTVLLYCVKAFRGLAFILIVVGIAAFIAAGSYVCYQVWIHLKGVFLVMSLGQRENLMILLVIATTPVAIGALGVLGTDTLTKKLKMA